MTKTRICDYSTLPHSTEHSTHKDRYIAETQSKINETRACPGAVRSGQPSSADASTKNTTASSRVYRQSTSPCGASQTLQIICRLLLSARRGWCIVAITALELPAAATSSAKGVSAAAAEGARMLRGAAAAAE